MIMRTLPYALALALMLGGCAGGLNILAPGTSAPPTSTPGSTPTPGPTSTPTPTPTPALGLVISTPTSFNFVAVGTGYAQDLDITQSNFSGTYAEADTCTGIVTVSPTSNTGGAAVYHVTPVAAGTCQITITGGGSMQAVVGVTVTTNRVIIQ